MEQVPENAEAPMSAEDSSRGQDASVQPSVAVLAKRVGADRLQDVHRLHEVMRQRREGCQEYASRTPEDSKTDAHSSRCATSSGPGDLIFESTPQGSNADAAHSGGAGVAAPSAPGQIVYESVPENSIADAKHHRAPTHARGSILELNSWKERAHAFKKPTSASFHAGGAQKKPSDKAAFSPASRSESASPESAPPPTSPDPSPEMASPLQSPPTRITNRASINVGNSGDAGADLSDFMSQMKSGCAVSDGKPAASAADAGCEPVENDGPRASSSLRSGEGLGEDSPLIDMETMRRTLCGGGSLSHASRSKLWTSRLGCSLEDSDASTCNVSEHFVSLLGGDEDQGEEVLFDSAGDAPPKSRQLKLAAAFSEKHLAWACLSDEPADMRKVFALMAQLLRYHNPAAAHTIDTAAYPLGLNLTTALCAVFDIDHAETDGEVCELFRRSANSFQNMFFAAKNSSDREVLLRLCDLIVIQDEELLVFFLALQCLMQVSFEFEGKPTLDSLKQQLRKGLMLRSLNDTPSVTSVAEALSLLEQTPVTLISLLVANSTGPPPSLPLCTVAPDELLHHIYERPSRPWRLVVVDARMTSDCQRLVLPIGIVLGAIPHKQRRQVLKDMAYEESIHLCLMGDGAPASGDDAFELCRYLLSSRVQRKHVSVVEGGWPAVEAHAKALNLDLMRVEPEAGQWQSSSGEFAKDSARLAFSEQVASAKEAGQKAAKAAQKMWAGAGRLFGASEVPRRRPSGEGS